MQPGIVYIWFNIQTHQTYVGSTDDESRRFREHYRALQNNTHYNSKLQRAYNQNPNFEFISIEVTNREEAFELEQAIIDEYWGNPYFLNKSRDARRVQYDVTDETRFKLSIAAKERMSDPKARDHLRQMNLGKKPSEETRAKMSEGLRGNQNALGFQHSDEFKEKIRERHSGKSKSEQTKRRMSETAKANGKTPEQLQQLNQISQARKKPILIDGVHYDSVNDAAAILGLGKTTVHYRVHSPGFPEWRFL